MADENTYIELFPDTESGELTLAMFNAEILEHEGQLVPCAGMTPANVADLIVALQSFLTGESL